MRKKKSGREDSTEAQQRRASRSSSHTQTTPAFSVRAPTPAAPQPQPVCFYPDVYKKLLQRLKRVVARLKTGKRRGGASVFFVQGAEGVGKTFLVRSVIRALGVQSLELGVDSLRSGQVLKKVFAEATQSFTVGTAKNAVRIIFIDDVDVVLAPDVGFTKALAELVADTKSPIVLAGQTVPSCLVDAVKLLQLSVDEDLLLDYFREFEQDEAQLRLRVELSQGRLSQLFGEFFLPRVGPEPLDPVQVKDLQAYSSLADLLVATSHKPKAKLGPMEFYKTHCLTQFIDARVGSCFDPPLPCVRSRRSFTGYVFK